jgi:hypothetical protein
MKLVIDIRGTIRCVYSEELNLRVFGALHISRGSQVEPALDGGWTVDLSPVVGPCLGPFDLRSDALLAEQQWLETHWLESRWLTAISSSTNSAPTAETTHA